MIRRIRAMLLAGVAMTIVADKAAAACSDLQDMDCRNQYVQANLPTIDQFADADPRKKERKTSLDKELAKIASIGTEMDRASGEIQQARRTGDQEEFATAEKAFGDAQKRLYAASNNAIALAIELYGLKPKFVDPAPGSPFVSWHPHYAEVDSKGQIIGTGGSAPVGGTSIYSGKLCIFPNAFVSAQELKNAIYHETVHWLNDNALGRTPTPYEDFKNEIFAYEEQIRAQGALGLSYDQTQRLRAKETRYYGYLRRISKSETWEHLPIDIPDYQMSQPLGSDSPDAYGTPGIDSDGNLRANVDVEQEIRRFRAAAKKEQEEAARQEDNRRADAALRERLADIAVKFCSGDSMIDQTALDALPIQNHDRFLNGPIPEIVAGAGCPHKIYMTIGLALARGQTPGIEELESLASSLPAAPARLPAGPPAAPPAPPIPAIAAPLPILPLLRQLAIDYCSAPSSVSDARLQSFAAYADDIGGQYWPETNEAGQSGLSGCADSIYRGLVSVGKSGRWWRNGLSRETLQSFAPAPTPPPAPLPLPQRERTRPDPSHCAASRGGACVWPSK